MRLTHDLRKLIKPAFLWMALYVVSSLVFVGVYVYVDYKNYLSSYVKTQQAELKAAQTKIRSNIDNLKKLSVLTSKRIASSQGDLKRIQNILNSSYSLLPDAESFRIEKMTYNKLSKPQSCITRFGTLPLNPEHTPSETPHQNGPAIIFHEHTIACKNWVFNGEGNLEGFLELSLDPSSFKATLPTGDTLSFVGSKAHALLQQDPFPIYGQIPDPFWKYAIKQQGLYALFFIFMLVVLIVVALNVHWLRERVKKTYRERIQQLKNDLSLSQAGLGKKKAALLVLQQQIHSQQISFQAYKKFQIAMRNHRKEETDYLHRSLNLIVSFYKKESTALPSKDLLEVIESCCKVTERFAEGAVSKVRNEPIKILSVLDNIQELFTEKIHKSILNVEVICSENLAYESDPCFLELVLINVIGRPLHSVPPQGKITIKATNQKAGLHIQVRDSGFFFDKKILNQLNQSFDFFLSQDVFRKICQDNNLRYEHYQGKNGFNVVKILFPKADARSLEGNVIPFSRKS
ncbi:MAG: hypothetical protein KBD90_06970 [Alphaproteobacteria bacterium]|nr:hypothetical protein [Alphaproteobacteria bacterium]